jgi:hypothetical protein
VSHRGNKGRDGDGRGRWRLCSVRWIPTNMHIFNLQLATHKGTLKAWGRMLQHYLTPLCAILSSHNFISPRKLTFNSCVSHSPRTSPRAEGAKSRLINSARREAIYPKLQLGYQPGQTYVNQYSKTPTPKSRTEKKENNPPTAT